MITVGVEEEYLLLDPDTGLPVPLGEEVRGWSGLAPVVDRREVQAELLQAQVEVATPVCTDLEEVGGHLLRLRHAVGAAAEEFGCRLATCGTAPFREPAPVPVTRQPRYLAIQAQAPQLVAEQLVNGMHVHAAVADPETGIAVLNRIRLWLPVLLAMSANSPIWDGHDTGFASWRTVIFGRWPVSGPPPYFADLADHERRIQGLLASKIISDPHQLYWQARLSDRYPTVEVRCMDVQLRVDDAVMFAGIVRALVATAVSEEKAGVPTIECAPELLHGANWYAARDGISGSLVAPDGKLRSAGDVLCQLMDHIAPALEESGDTREVTSLVHRLLREGTPADLQRRALAEGGVRALTDLVTTQSTPP